MCNKNYKAMEMTSILKNFTFSEWLEIYRPKMYKNFRGAAFEFAALRGDLEPLFVEAYYNATGQRLNVGALRSKTRLKNIATFRRRTAWILRDGFDLPLQFIARVVGRDHSTIIHYIKRTRELNAIYADERFESFSYLEQFQKLFKLQKYLTL